ncbi:MAG: hypothetical protein IPP74_13500 [Alphaproteobacteria bacterium]|nr:hypothetical protein [Alphaproteobacteria bacterium]
MILDKGLILSDAQVVTTTATSTDYIDQLAAGDAIGAFGWFICSIAVTLATGTSIKVTLQHDSDSAFGTVTTLVDGPVLTTAVANAAKTLLAVKIPLNAKRYIRANYTIVGTYDTGSAVDAFITFSPQTLFK